MCEPVSVSYEGMFTRAGGFKPGGAVVVFGAGPIGLAAVALAAAGGASTLLCIESVLERRELALRLGATHAADPAEHDPGDLTRELTRGRGAAMVVECSGNWPAVMGSVEACLAVGGKVAVIGMDARPPVMNLIRYQLSASAMYHGGCARGAARGDSRLAFLGAGDEPDARSRPGGGWRCRREAASRPRGGIRQPWLATAKSLWETPSKQARGPESFSPHLGSSRVRRCCSRPRARLPMMRPSLLVRFWTLTFAATHRMAYSGFPTT